MTTQTHGQREAISVSEFCECYCVGRTKAYELFKSEEVETRKMGTRRLVSRRSAERWFESPPTYRFELD